MTYPAGVIERELTFGIPFGVAGGDDLVMRLQITPTRSMVWGPDGWLGIKRQRSVVSEVGQQGSVSLAVSDQNGWLDGAGNAIVVGNGAYSHGYVIKPRIETPDGNVVDDTLPVKTIVLPQDDLSPVDFDRQLSLPSIGGFTVSIPDQWSAQIAAFGDRLTELEQNGGSGTGTAASGVALDTDGVPYIT